METSSNNQWTITVSTAKASITRGHTLKKKTWKVRMIAGQGESPWHPTWRRLPCEPVGPHVLCWSWRFGSLKIEGKKIEDIELLFIPRCEPWCWNTYLTHMLVNFLYMEHRGYVLAQVSKRLSLLLMIWIWIHILDIVVSGCHIRHRHPCAATSG